MTNREPGERYYVHELWTAAREHHPEILSNAAPQRSKGALAWLRAALSTETDERFVRPTQRELWCDAAAWAFPIHRDRRSLLAMTYKGLLNAKPPFDLALYSRLLWELQPRTVIEFGALQGGSALWFADQASVLCEQPAQVHSFDFRPELISARARHPRVEFHRADLRDLDSLDTDLLARLPHPWLVVDDAHANIVNLFLLVDGFMRSGDYYVVEDAPTRGLPVRGPRAQASWAGRARRLLRRVRDAAARRFRPGASNQRGPEAGLAFAPFLRTAENAGYLVDTYYVDAFGHNVTCAPNAWLRKS